MARPAIGKDIFRAAFYSSFPSRSIRRSSAAAPRSWRSIARSPSPSISPSRSRQKGHDEFLKKLDAHPVELVRTYAAKMRTGKGIVTMNLPAPSLPPAWIEQLGPSNHYGILMQCSTKVNSKTSLFELHEREQK
jgi:hypothetical protein